MRLIYFIYFILKSDYKSVFKGIRCAQKYKHPLSLLFDAMICSLKYGTSLDDYFSFRFYYKSKEQRKAFATTAYMYVFHKRMNDKHTKQKIDDKSQFRKHFKKFAGISEVFDASSKQDLLVWLKENKINQLVVKDPLGTVGKTVQFFSYKFENKSFTNKTTTYSLDEVFRHFSINGSLYVEPKIVQHTLIQKLAPTALNTIRVITVVSIEGRIDIISAAFRISVNSETDNFSTGNLAAAVDIPTGLVISPGIKRLAACSDNYESHPVTNQKILGLQVPHWGKVIELVKEAALVFPQVRTVGWDVAILEDKPIIIEGNPSWNKGAPQIPLDQGIKPLLDKYIS